jgi:hypothetical protein
MSLDTGDTAWILMSCALVNFMTPGLAFFYGGLVRRNHVLRVAASTKTRPQSLPRTVRFPGQHATSRQTRHTFHPPAVTVLVLANRTVRKQLQALRKLGL